MTRHSRNGGESRGVERTDTERQRYNEQKNTTTIQYHQQEQQLQWQRQRPATHQNTMQNCNARD